MLREKRLLLSVWDIGGQSVASANLGGYISGANLCFLTYDVTNLESFRNVVTTTPLLLPAYASYLACICLGPVLVDDRACCLDRKSGIKQSQGNATCAIPIVDSTLSATRSIYCTSVL